jgi:hypothetical protein
MYRPLVRNWFTCSLLILALIGSGCKGGNIFGFRGPSDDNVSDLLAKGQDRLREGKVEEALELFGKAIEADDKSSDARFYHAKATLIASGLSIVQLLRDVTTNANTPGSDFPLYSPEPGLSKEADEAKKTRIYRAAKTLIDDLTPIARGTTTGSFDSTDVGLDLAIANTIFGVLQLRDTNNDLEIKTPPDIFFNFRILDRSGDIDYSIEDLADAIFEGDSLAAAEGFNFVINDLVSGNDGESIVQKVLKYLQQAGLGNDDTSIDLTELTKTIETLGDRAGIYLINTGVPGNPGEGDNDNDGRIDEELLNGIDDDNDGIIDEDTRLNP